MEKHITPARSWNFDNSYARLPPDFYTRLAPGKVAAPRLVILNTPLLHTLGLDNIANGSEEELARLFCGTQLPPGAEPLAQAYAGHQFGHFAMLGDGRAHLIGEHITPDGQRVDIQFKGSGKTPYGRRGDGYAALAPMLREYIISEAMHALGIATTRSLAVVATGKPVYRETTLPGAVLTRVAASHLRVGTFQYIAATGDKAQLTLLADYAINRHYPDLKDSAAPYADLLRAVQARQIALVTDWLRVGFIHGVMNTDNMTISGETIDYGPCAFMDSYDPQTVFSAIDQQGRYAFGNQPSIAMWNLIRFAEALLPLLHPEPEKAVALAEDIIRPFNEQFQSAWLAMMRGKLGLTGEDENDNVLISDLLGWMQQHKADYTNTFQNLTAGTLPEAAQPNDSAFTDWQRRWRQRQAQHTAHPDTALNQMRRHNPMVIPRNHRVEEALQAAEEDNSAPLHQLLAALTQPYRSDPPAAYADYQKPPAASEQVYQTFCGT